MLQWEHTPGVPVCEPGGTFVTGVCLGNAHIPQEGCESRVVPISGRGVSAGGLCGLWGGGVHITLNTMGLEFWGIRYEGYFEIRRYLLTFHKHLVLWFCCRITDINPACTVHWLLINFMSLKKSKNCFDALILIWFTPLELSSFFHVTEDRRVLTDKKGKYQLPQCHPALRQNLSGAPKLSTLSHRWSTSSMRTDPRLRACCMTWGEAAGWREPSRLAGAAWEQPHVCNSLPGTTLEAPWKSMVWTSQLLHTCRNLFLKPRACNTLSICTTAGQTAMLAETLLPLCGSCCALLKTNIDHCSSTGLGGLCSSSCNGNMWMRRHLLCIHTHDPDGGLFRSASGFCLLLRSSNPDCNPSKANSLFLKEEAPVRCSD